MSLFDDVKEVVVEQLNVTFEEDFPKRDLPYTRPERQRLKREYNPSANVREFLGKFSRKNKRERLQKEQLDEIERFLNEGQQNAIVTVKDAVAFIEDYDTRCTGTLLYTVEINELDKTGKHFGLSNTLFKTKIELFEHLEENWGKYQGEHGFDIGLSEAVVELYVEVKEFKVK